MARGATRRIALAAPLFTLRQLGCKDEMNPRECFFFARFPPLQGRLGDLWKLVEILKTIPFDLDGEFNFLIDTVFCARGGNGEVPEERCSVAALSSAADLPALSIRRPVNYSGAVSQVRSTPSLSCVCNNSSCGHSRCGAFTCVSC